MRDLIRVANVKNVLRIKVIEIGMKSKFMAKIC